MANQKKNEVQIAELIERYYLDSLSEEEFQELTSALNDNRSWRDRFRRSARMDALLRYQSAAPPDAELSAEFTASTALVRQAIQSGSEVEDPDKGTTGWIATVWRAPSFRFAAFATSIATVGFILLALNYDGKNDQSIATVPVAQIVEKVDDGIAMVGGTVDATWVGTELDSGMSVPRGRIELKSGLAQLEFYSGATVILEGPAMLDLKSAEEAILLSGSLSAHVPMHARGFVVRSADTRLVDLGTEFVLNVTADKGTEVHVINGEVQVYPFDERGAEVSARSMKSGDAMRFRKGTTADTIDLASQRFVDPTELEQQVLANDAASLERWRSSIGLVAEDPRIVAYYSFGHLTGQARRLGHGHPQQLLSGKLSELDGTIVGARWSDGRWPGKDALDFKRPGDRVRIAVPRQFESITLIASVRVDGLDNAFNSLLLSEGWDRPGAIHWQIQNEGGLELAVWNGPDEAAHDSVVGFTLDPSEFGRWMQLAVVYDGARGRVTHYRDGSELGTVPVVPTVPIEIGDAQLGNWNPLDWSDPRPVRNFNGRIDEFMIFGAALETHEIRALLP